jgi:hypothetical protein
MADVPLLPSLRPRRLATISRYLLTAELQLLAPGPNSPTAASRPSPLTSSQLPSKQASSSLLLAFASMVILGVEPHRDP